MIMPEDHCLEYWLY